MARIGVTMTRQDLVVRPCRIHDLSRIGCVLKASWHSAHDRILGRIEAVRIGRKFYSKFNLGLLFVYAQWSSPNFLMLVATLDGTTVGLATAQGDDGSEVILYGLYVDPEWHGRGIGSALLDAVIAAHPDAKAIRLEVLRDNTAAIAWYTTKGFETYGETQSATGTVGVAALYMDKKIDRTSASSSRSSGDR